MGTGMTDTAVGQTAIFNSDNCMAVLVVVQSARKSCVDGLRNNYNSIIFNSVSLLPTVAGFCPSTVLIALNDS